MSELIDAEGGIKLLWDTEHLALCVNFEKGWNPDIFFRMVHRANAFVAKQPVLNGVILCFLESGLSPAVNLFELGRQTIRQLPKNVKNIVVVDNRQSTQFFMQAFARMFPFHIPGKEVRFFVADSMDAAYEALLS